MKPTLRDVARKAEVSFQLVSAVLGGKDYVRASAETRERIKQAAAELGYVANIHARRLRSGESRIIGVLVDSAAPFSVKMLVTELEKAASRCNYRLMTAEAHDSPEQLYQSYLSLRQNSVDAVIMLNLDYPESEHRIDELLGGEKNLVSVCGPHNGELPNVDFDIEGGVVSAVEHLHNNGFRKTALLCASEKPYHRSVLRRIAGFKSVEKNGTVIMIPPGIAGEPASIGDDVKRVIAERLIPEKIDSVIALNDYCAAILEKELLNCGMKVPHDIAIVGFDNLPVCQCMPVPLSSVTCDRSKVAELAVETAISLIHGRKYPGTRTVPAQLAIRESSVKNVENIVGSVNLKS